MSKATQIREVTSLELASADEIRSTTGLITPVEYLGKAGRLYEIQVFADLAQDLGDLMEGELNADDEARFMAAVDEHMSRARGTVEYLGTGDSRPTQAAENVFQIAAAKRFLEIIESL